MHFAALHCKALLLLNGLCSHSGPSAATTLCVRRQHLRKGGQQCCPAAAAAAALCSAFAYWLAMLSFSTRNSVLHGCLLLCFPAQVRSPSAPASASECCFAVWQPVLWKPCALIKAGVNAHIHGSGVHSPLAAYCAPSRHGQLIGRGRRAQSHHIVRSRLTHSD